MPRANPAESLFAFGYSLDVGRICLKNNTSIILIIFRILFRIILKNLFYPGPSVVLHLHVGLVRVDKAWPSGWTRSRAGDSSLWNVHRRVTEPPSRITPMVDCSGSYRQDESSHFTSDPDWRPSAKCHTSPGLFGSPKLSSTAN
jgi:hypothetical protein